MDGDGVTRLTDLLHLHVSRHYYHIHGFVMYCYDVYVQGPGRITWASKCVWFGARLVGRRGGYPRPSEWYAKRD